MIEILYFASLRERVGCARERLALPEEATNVAALRQHLSARGSPWREALETDQRVLAAVNQAFARPDTPLRDGDEIAFFPPVTGG